MLYPKIQSTKQTWSLASKFSPNTQFDFYESHPFLNSISLGASFSRHRWEQTGSNFSAIEGLKFAVDKLGIRQVRLDIRWNECQKNPDNIQLTTELLDYAFDTGLEVCLNLGPIKTFGWPESHVPQWVLARITKTGKIPRKVDLQSQLGRLSLDYLGKLLDQLELRYGPDLGSKIHTWQIENEVFTPFGEKIFKMQYDYLSRLIELIATKNPHPRILLNSAGRYQLRKIGHFFTQATSNLKIQPVIGLDYYYTINLLEKYPVLKRFDLLNLARPWDWSVQDLIDIASSKGWGVEVTEAQFEPWHLADGPGNSLVDFQFMLLRLGQYFQPTKYAHTFQQPLLIRLWGVERFVSLILDQKDTPKHRRILHLIQKINFSKNPDLNT
jgi:hypothetical protein